MSAAVPAKAANVKLPDATVKLIMIGDSGVGKSCLLKCFMGEPFDHASTIGVDFAIKTIQVDGRNITTQIWDTAGQERFRTITASYYKSSQAIMLVYDVTDFQTFRSLDIWLNDIRSNAATTVDILVCANKVDDKSREVSFETGRNWAEANGTSYIEVSAYQNYNIEKAFTAVATAASLKVVNIPRLVVPNINFDEKKSEPAQSGGCC